MESVHGGLHRGGCTHHHNNDTQNAYVNTHNPFVYYQDIYISTARCSRIVNANPGSEGYMALPSVLLSDLNSASSSSNFMWLTPNECDDGHSTCTMTASKSTECPSTSLAQCVSQSNRYLSVLVPEILGSVVFKTQNAALFITWDEGTQNYPKDFVTTIWAGPLAQTSHKSTTFYTHYSFLRTLEVMWNIPAMSAFDAAATSMGEFFFTRSAALPGGGSGRIMKL